MSVLENINPVEVMRYFEKLSQIPRGSRNEKAVSDYCVEEAKRLGLEVWQDEANNVIIHKPATKGREDEPGVIIQGHLDMVCVKDEDSSHNFETDPLDLKVKDGYIYAEKTSLGGDDGIAVACALALLASDSISHPDVECIFTTGEEIGLLGAVALEAGNIHNRRLLNIDSEVEGVLTVGCAGGCKIKLTTKNECEKLQAGKLYAVELNGILGGHSGIMIDKGRLNANVAMVRILKNLLQADFDIRLNSITGGNADNAIPKECRCEFFLEADKNSVEITKIVEDTVKGMKREYAASDAGLNCTIEVESVDERTAMTVGDTKRVVGLMTAIPDGIVKMSHDIPGLVETSLNCGVVKTQTCDGMTEVSTVYALRSSLAASIKELKGKLSFMAECFDASCQVSGEYPGWEYRSDSPLRDKMIAVFEEQYGHKPVVESIHAGLECGILSEKLDDLDAVSFGPNIIDIHSAREKLDIASVERVWKYLVGVLERKD